MSVVFEKPRTELTDKLLDVHCAGGVLPFAIQNQAVVLTTEDLEEEEIDEVEVGAGPRQNPVKTCWVNGWTVKLLSAGRPEGFRTTC